jgi:cbb3-type cytochrome oxidase maturation protein
MSVLYLVLPLALLFAGAAVAAFAWTVRSGQLDDVDTPPRRILFDDDRAAIARCAPSAAADAPERGHHGRSDWHSS